MNVLLRSTVAIKKKQQSGEFYNERLCCLLADQNFQETSPISNHQPCQWSCSLHEIHTLFEPGASTRNTHCGVNVPIDVAAQILGWPLLV